MNGVRAPARGHGAFLQVSWSRFGSWLLPDNGAMTSMPALDGLRALAVGLVLLFHAWNQQPDFLAAGQWEERYPMYYARTGVHLFFVLSGFLLFLPYARWLLHEGGRPSAARFYKRRALRVGPAYLVCLTVLTLAGPRTLAAAADWLLHTTFLFNLLPQSMFTINGVFWTMAVEVQFYLLLPALAWLTYALSSRTGPLKATVTLVACLTAISFASSLAGRSLDPGNDRVLLTGLLGPRSVTYFLSVFGAGIGCSVAYAHLSRSRSAKPSEASRLMWAGSGIFLLGVGLGTALVFTSAISASFGRNSLFGLVYASVLFGILFGAPLLRRPFELRPVRFLGLISYSFYLWHLVVLAALMPSLHHLANSTDRLALGVVASLLGAVPIAYLSYLLSERPFIGARRRAHDPAF